MIVRNTNRRRYVKVCLDTLADTNLDARSYQVLMYLLTRPDHWVIQQKQLSNERLGCRGSIQETFRRLEAQGYLVRTSYRRHDGKIGWTHEIHECGSHEHTEDEVDRHRPVYGRR